MSVEIYNNLITKTFRDDAIRSVMMIDDDFLPYDELVEKLTTNSLTAPQIVGTKRASNLHSFFQKTKKIVCDIDSGTEHLDINKIRKSDLVILDYELELKDPTRSIQLISDLRNSVHMNLVVLYTQEPDLETVWLRIASNLRGRFSENDIFKGNQIAEKKWEEITESGTKTPDELIQKITNEDLTKYILENKITKRTATEFGKVYQQIGQIISQATCERAIEKRYAINSQKNDSLIIGENSDVKWLQSGNVFVVLHNKSTGENESEELWQALNTALHRWQPSYYRLLISEMQNLLENESISFDASLKSDLAGQAAWLHQIISEPDTNKKDGTIGQLMDRLTDELKIKIIENSGLKNTISEIISSLSTTAQISVNEDHQNAAQAKDKVKTAEANKKEKELEAANAESEKIAAEGKAQASALMKTFAHENGNAATELLAQSLTAINATTNIIECTTEALSSVIMKFRTSTIALVNSDLAAQTIARNIEKNKIAAAKLANKEAAQAITDAKKISEKAERSLIAFAAKHVKANATEILQFETDMLHALNRDLCLRSFSGGYVTSGTVLKAENGRWFLCVSPACETVPEQPTGGEPTKRLAPHRLMKFIILEECKTIRAALEKAVDGRHIFVMEQDGTRRAFAVQSGDAHQPTIDFAVIHEHDNSYNMKIHQDGITVSFIDRKEKTGKLFANRITLKPVAQLRDSYAARFQTVASQHAGRVGVDFISIREIVKDKKIDQSDTMQKHSGENRVDVLFQSGSQQSDQAKNIAISENR